MLALRQQLDVKRQEVAQANKATSDLRIVLKEQESEFERRRRELAERANLFETEARKYKE